MTSTRTGIQPAGSCSMHRTGPHAEPKIILESICIPVQSIKRLACGHAGGPVPPRLPTSSKICRLAPSTSLPVEKGGALQTLAPRTMKVLGDHLDHVLQATVGAADVRTLSPSDFSALRSALAAQGLLRHPGLPAALRLRRLQPDAVLWSVGTSTPAWGPVTRAPSWGARAAGPASVTST